MTTMTIDESLLNAKLNEDTKKVLFVPFESINNSRTTLVTAGALLLIGLSYTALGYYIMPMIIAGAITEYTYLAICLGLAVVWTVIGKITSKYLRQYILATKGEINKD